MLFEGKHTKTNLQGLSHTIGGQMIDKVGTNCKEKYFKFVGHVLDDQFTWIGHLEHICKNKYYKTFSPPKSQTK